MPIKETKGQMGMMKLHVGQVCLSERATREHLFVFHSIFKQSV